MDDYAPDKEEMEDKLMQEEESNEGNEGNEGNDDNKREKLTNDLAEIGHVLDDEFCEYVRPDPNQQIALTRQGNIDFDKVWREVEEIDKRLLLNDILPPGLHGEKWSGNVTRSFVSFSLLLSSLPSLPSLPSLLSSSCISLSSSSLSGA